jgi:hypothetical protein
MFQTAHPGGFFIDYSDLVLIDPPSMTNSVFVS